MYWVEALIPDISAESWPKLNAADDRSLENPCFNDTRFEFL